MVEVEKYRVDFKFIVIDGSKRNERVGFGICIPDLKYNFPSKLPDTVCICRAEIVAIHEAIKSSINEHFSKAIIFSDSMSTISKLGKNLLPVSADYWTIRTKRLIILTNEYGFDIRSAWIPGHSGIKGNTEADTLANIGKNLNIPKPIKVDSMEMYTVIEEKMRNKFKIN